MVMGLTTEGTTITVVTVVRNELAGLKRTSDSLLRQTSLDFEWLIVDGFSNDGTELLAKELEVAGIAKLITLPPAGIYDAMNNGIENANGDYLVFLNAGDFFVSEDSISTIHTSLISRQQSLAFPVIQMNTAGHVVDIAMPVLKMFNRHLVLDANHQGFVMKRSTARSLGNFDLSLKFAADGKLMDGVAETEGVSLESKILTAFVVGGASSLNITRTLKEINVYRKSLSKSQILLLSLKTNLRSRAYDSNNITMKTLNRIIRRRAQSRVQVKLERCEPINHWHKSDGSIPEYSCCLKTKESAIRG